MRELIGLYAALVTIVFIGANIFYAICGTFKRFCRTESLFASYGLGIGFLSLEMIVFYIFGIGFSVPGLLAPWALLIGLNTFLFMRRGGAISFACPADEREGKGSLLNIVLTAGISLEIVYAFFRALIKPIESYDAIAIYAIKSKIFFLAKAIPQVYFPSLVHGFPHPDYPLNIPLAETFLYMAMGSLNDQLVKLIFPLFFVGILCVLYFAIRRFAGRTYALLFTFILASIPQFNAYATNAYQELPTAFYYFASAIALFAWLDNKEDIRILVLSAVMVALAGWTKNEGMLYCVINAFLVLVFSMGKGSGKQARDLLAPILYIAIIGAILAPWLMIKHKYGIVNDEINLANINPAYLAKQLPKLGPIFYELQKQLFGPKKWILLWPVVIAAAVLKYRELFKGVTKYITLSLALAFCGYVLFYLVSYVDVVFFASKTWSRFLLHFVPLVVLWLAYLLKEDITI